MTTPNLVLLQGAQAGDGGMVSMLLMMAVLFAIVYFFMIRPQNKKQKEIQKFRDALKAGDDVVRFAESREPSSALITTRTPLF